MGDVATPVAAPKEVSDRSAAATSGNQSWNGNAARECWGRPPVSGQRADASPTAAAGSRDSAGEVGQKPGAQGEQAAASKGTSDQSVASNQSAAGDQASAAKGDQSATKNQTAAPSDSAPAKSDQSAAKPDQTTAPSESPKAAAATDSKQANSDRSTAQRDQTSVNRDQTATVNDQSATNKDQPVLKAEQPVAASESTAATTDQSAANSDRSATTKGDQSTVNDDRAAPPQQPQQEQLRDDSQKTQTTEFQLSAVESYYPRLSQEGQHQVWQAAAGSLSHSFSEINAGVGDGATRFTTSLATTAIDLSLRAAGVDNALTMAKTVMNPIGEIEDIRNRTMNFVNGVQKTGDYLVSLPGDPLRPFSDIGNASVNAYGAAQKAADDWMNEGPRKQTSDGVVAELNVAPFFIGGEALGLAKTGDSAVGGSEIAGATKTDATIGVAATETTMGAKFKSNMEDLYAKMKATAAKYGVGADATETSDAASATKRIDDLSQSDEAKGNRFDKITEAQRNEQLARAREIRARDNVPVSQEFTNRVGEAEQGLTDAQRQFLADYNVSVNAVRHIADVPQCETNLDWIGATVRDKGKVGINLAETVWHNREWADNPDLTFSIRHELGHAINMLSKTDLISNESWFARSVGAEVRSLSDTQLLEMGISKTEFLTDPTYAEDIRDEIFSDLYAHMTPNLESNNPFSLKVKDAFSDTLKKMQQHTEIIR